MPLTVMSERQGGHNSRHLELVARLAGGRVTLNSTPAWEGCMQARVKNLQAALSEKSGQCYSYWWGKYERFCEEMKIPQLPFSTLTASLFLSKRAEDSEGMGGVEGARAALRYYWNLRYPFKQCPADSIEVKSVIGGIKRRFQKPVQKSTALCVTDFQKVLKTLTKEGKLEEVTMKDLRMAAQMSVMYCTFARFEEVKALKVKQVKVEGSGLVIDFLKGKQYQHGECRMSVMPAQDQLKIDPVQVVKTYTRRLKNMGAEDGSHLFPCLAFKSGSLRIMSQPATYDCVRKQFKKAIEQSEVEGDTSRYSLHSLRRGAVTGAVNNGCDDHTVRKQMRVASVATVQRYASMDNERLKCATNKLFKK